MARTYGTITFKDSEGGQSPVRIMNPTDGAKLALIAAGIKAQSNAVWTKYRVDTENGTPGTPAADAYKLVKTKAILTFRNENDEIFKCTIPAPKAAIIVGNDSRVDATVGATIATLLSTNTDNGTLTFLQGKMFHRSPK